MDYLPKLKQLFNEDNIDLFNLSIKTHRELLQPILQEDNLEYFIYILIEINCIGCDIRSSYRRKKIFQPKIDYDEYRDYNVEYLVKKDDKIVNKNVYKSLKTEWKWFINENIKSKTCKIIRFMTSMTISSAFLVTLNKLSKKLTNIQKKIISSYIKILPKEEDNDYNKKLFKLKKIIVDFTKDEKYMWFEENSYIYLESFGYEKINLEYRTGHSIHYEFKFLMDKDYDDPLLKQYMNMIQDLLFLIYDF